MQRTYREKYVPNGGKARAKKAKDQKKFNDLFNNFLAQPVKQKDLIEAINALGIDNKDVTNKMALVISLWQSACTGNAKAFEIIQNTIGEKPQDTVNLNVNKKLEDFLK